MIVLAIDPGNVESAFCMINTETLRPIDFGKVKNEELLFILEKCFCGLVVIERVASYGMAVGKDVFETCEWVGRFTQVARTVYYPVEYIYRKDEKLHICGDSRANDTNIRHALIDRFARHDFKTGKGTKKNPDFFYGFKSDIWAAYAVGITYIETKMEKDPK